MAPLPLSFFFYLLVFLGTDLPSGNENGAKTLRSQVRYMYVPSPLYPFLSYGKINTRSQLFKHWIALPLPSG